MQLTMRLLTIGLLTATLFGCRNSLSVLRFGLGGPESPAPAVAAEPLAPAIGELLLPENRSAYLSRESIELAVAGLNAGQPAVLSLTTPGMSPVELPLTGDGGTVTLRLPPNALAPGDYAIHLDGRQQQARLTIRRGVASTTLHVSQTQRQDQLRESGGTYAVSNAFSFGLLDRNRQPASDLRRLSSGLQSQESLIAADLPSLIYMYWTGYVLHKPWGIHKEWCSPDMTENMRLFNYHVAQRLRRFAPNIISVGTIDEPGLPWGKTPAGGAASGFPGWNTADWYGSRGWTYADDPASGSADDWMRYLAIRCGMLYEQQLQASRDLKTVWPEMIFSTDLYAPHAMMDGTDPWNQRANDIPCTHVFVDWGYGKLGALSGLYLEKAHDPASKVAHAMNGQLFGTRVTQPQTRYAYHLMMNALLAGGLDSNWWLNFGGMAPADLAAVNEPAARLGPLFREVAPTDHEVAVLWSFTELGMRLKDITAMEARKESGTQITFMISEYPEAEALDKGELTVNAYSVGSNYKLPVLAVHQALARAGYPAHIVHEKLLDRKYLDRYKVLVIYGQKHPLPASVNTAIARFVSRGGIVLVDESTTVEIPGARRVELGLKDMGYRWSARFDEKDPADAKRPAADGLYQTNFWADGFARDAVVPLREAMQQTGASPVFRTNHPWLAAERHVGGDGELQMLINAREELGARDDKGLIPVYNYAPLSTQIDLTRLPADRVAYLIEGLDWRQVSPLSPSDARRTLQFQPGEMKLVLTMPKAPLRLSLSGDVTNGELRVKVQALREAPLMPLALHVPLPLEIRAVDAAGNELFRVWRATDAKGRCRERFPVGRNLPEGQIQLTVNSPIGLAVTAELPVGPRLVEPATFDAPVRVFDEGAIEDFLDGKPALTVVYATAARQAIAEELATRLREAGLQASARPEASVWRKALYPRVWDPFIQVHQPETLDRPLPEESRKNAAGETIKVTPTVIRELTIESDYYDTPSVQTPDGEPVGGKWQEPGTLLTVRGGGYIEITGMGERFYRAGCKLYVNDKRQLVLINGRPVETKTTAEVRAAWSRPWLQLGSYVGAAPLIPQLPEAYAADAHLILLGDSDDSELVRALQASELLPRMVDANSPGPGKAFLQFAWSPFALEKNVIYLGATDEIGLQAAMDRLLKLAR